MLSKDKQIYALKKISLEGDEGGAGHVANYRNEINLLRRLRGKRHCIQLVDYEEQLDDKIIYMVFELGQMDLAHVIKQARHNDAQLPATTVRHYWHEILECVQSCHRDKVIHLDLKPANFVFVDGILKIIDFGIAKQVGNEQTSIIRENQVGTVSYMAPETITASESNVPPGQFKLRQSADIWSLGCILYELVYGKPPFYHKSLIQKIHSITDPNYIIPFPELSLGNPDSLLLDVLRHCLNRNPRKRPTIEELLAHPLVNPAGTTLLRPSQAAVDENSLRHILEQLVPNTQSARLDNLAQSVLQQLQAGTPVQITPEFKSTQS